MNQNQWENQTQLLGDGALKFDGGSERISLGNMDAPSAQLTLSAWINPSNISSNNGEGRIISKASGSNESEHYWMLSTDENGASIVPRVRLKTNGQTTTLLANSGAIVPNNPVSYTHLTLPTILLV